MPTPPEYRRRVRSGELNELHGQRAKVYAVTTVTEPPARFEAFAPYDETIVEFPDGKRRTFMGMYGEKFEIGEEVECAPGAFPVDERGLIAYRIKVRHPVIDRPLSPLK